MFADVNGSYAFGGILWAKTLSGGFIYSNVDRIASDMGTSVDYLAY